MKVKKDFIAWVKAHKKQLVATGVSITTIVLIVVGIKNKSEIIRLWGILQERMERGEIYSSKWFDTATNAELDFEREKVRLAYCSSGGDIHTASILQNLLWRFDDEMSKRAWGDEIPRAPAFHRENGWYLPNDD